MAALRRGPDGRRKLERAVEVLLELGMQGNIAALKLIGDNLDGRVRAGMALAFVRYSRDYEPQEAAAKAEGKGVHAHDCIAAWEWRARPGGATRL